MLTMAEAFAKATLAGDGGSKESALRGRPMGLPDFMPRRRPVSSTRYCRMVAPPVFLGLFLWDLLLLLLLGARDFAGPKPNAIEERGAVDPPEEEEGSKDGGVFTGESSESSSLPCSSSSPPPRSDREAMSSRVG